MQPLSLESSFSELETAAPLTLRNSPAEALFDNGLHGSLFTLRQLPHFFVKAIWYLYGCLHMGNDITGYGMMSPSSIKTTYQQAGMDIPAGKHFVFEPYYERDNNKWSTPNRVNAFGPIASSLRWLFGPLLWAGLEPISHRLDTEGLGVRSPGSQLTPTPLPLSPAPGARFAGAEHGGAGERGQRAYHYYPGRRANALALGYTPSPCRG